MIKIQTALHTQFKDNQTLNMLLKNIRDGLIVCNANGDIIFLNQAFKNFFYVDHKILGENISQVIDNPTLIIQITNALAQNTPIVDEQKMLVETPAARGEATITRQKIFDIQYIPLKVETTDTQSEPESCVIIFHDMTEVRQTEKMRRDFVANVSHELRTPLSAIEGYSETLLEGGLQDESVRENFVTIIHKNSLRLGQLVKDLLDLSKLESPDFVPDLGVVNIQDIYNKVHSLIDDKADSKNISMTAQFEHENILVLADQNSLEQVVVNLLDNAIKYSPIGGKIEFRVFEISDDDGQQKIQIDVKDNGMGIDPKHFKRIFERFYRVDKARSREMGGTGLGLSIVKHIIQLHGGNIWVNSQVDTGSTFSFTLDKAP